MPQVVRVTGKLFAKWIPPWVTLGDAAMVFMLISVGTETPVQCGTGTLRRVTVHDVLAAALDDLGAPTRSPTTSGTARRRPMVVMLESLGTGQR